MIIKLKNVILELDLGRTILKPIMLPHISGFSRFRILIRLKLLEGDP
jgi:hypothetical protein